MRKRPRTIAGSFEVDSISKTSTSGNIGLKKDKEVASDGLTECQKSRRTRKPVKAYLQVLTSETKPTDLGKRKR